MLYITGSSPTYSVDSKYRGLCARATILKFLQWSNAQLSCVGLQVVKAKSEIEELKEANKTVLANAKRDTMVLEVCLRKKEASL